MKSRDCILKPDPRSAGFRKDSGTGELRLMAIEDIYDLLQPLTGLLDTAPIAIRNQFQLALDTFLYSWFSHELATVAERHGYAVVEMALREKLTGNGRQLTGKEGLKSLLDMAVRDGWLRQSDFELAALTGKFSLLDFLPKFRNDLAHGSTNLFAVGSLEMIRLCADIIRKLFPSTTASR